MDDPEEHRLVHKALTACPHNCVLWKNDRVERRILGDPALLGLTPVAIKRLLREHVRGGGEVEQHRETDPAYADLYRFRYWSIVEHDDFPTGLFIEYVLHDRSDEDFPLFHLVNAHGASFRRPKR